MLPIYQSTETYKQAKLIFNDKSHSGLWFERFYDYQIFENNGNPLTNEQDKKKAKIAEKDAFFKTFNGQRGVRECGNEKNLQAYAQRQSALCHAQDGKSTIYQNDWLMAIGLGNSHPLENGLLWHPTLGVPYFQGSTVKGMAKALMEQWGADPKLIKRWFGSVNATTSKTADFDEMFGMSLSEDLRKTLDEQSIGAFIFLDAVPVKPVMLKQSIMTPHYGDWYQKGDSKPTDKNVQPGDWHSPVPVSFLAVKKAVMQFGVMPRLGANVTDDELEQISNVITMALEHLGIGAKTATGYGRMQKDEKAEREQKEKIQQALQEKANAERLKKAEEALTQAIANLNDNQAFIYKFKEKLSILGDSWKNNPNATHKVEIDGESYWFVEVFKKLETWNDDDQKYALNELFIPNQKSMSNKMKDRVKELKKKLGIH